MPQPIRTQASLKSLGRQDGFTLMEILVALFIFALIAATLFGSFEGVFSRSAELDEGLYHQEMGVLALSHMQRELQEIFIHQPPAYSKPEPESPESPYRIIGDESDLGGETFGRLRFATLTQLPMDSQAIRPPRAVIYYVDQADDGGLILKRALRANDDQKDPFEPQTDDAVLCEDLLELTFSFVDAEGENQSQWDSESEEQAFATPRAIKIELMLGTQGRTTRFGTTVTLPVWRNPLES